MLSVSTCWNSARHTDGAAMLEELAACGFRAVELGHGVRVSLLPGVQKAVEAGVARISSLHNFCPLPLEITHASPDCFQFTAGSRAERERAVRLTWQTIDFAKRLGAPKVVLHCGRAAMPPITPRLLALIRNRQHFGTAYVRAKLEAVRQREAASAPALARVRECLKRIAGRAEENGIQLGLEGRAEYEELPTPREMLGLLEENLSPAFGYWHDFGHLQRQANLGFIDHARWLRQMAPRLLGCHVHDVEWPARDHRPPFSAEGPGRVEFEKLIPLLHENCLFVWEMSPRVARADLEASLAQWRRCFPETDRA